MFNQQQNTTTGLFRQQPDLQPLYWRGHKLGVAVLYYDKANGGMMVNSYDLDCGLIESIPHKRAPLAIKQVDAIADRYNELWRTKAGIRLVNQK